MQHICNPNPNPNPTLTADSSNMLLTQHICNPNPNLNPNPIVHVLRLLAVGRY